MNYAKEKCIWKDIRGLSGILICVSSNC